jgi:tetratricopeptide (TPR) repeat protein
MDIDALETLLKTGGFEQAKAMVRAAEDYVPADDATWTRLHRCLQQLGMATHDEIVALRYLRQRPDASFPRMRLASHFMRRARRDDAEYHLNLAIATPTSDSEFWKIASDIYIFLKRPMEAISAYNRALELAPKNFWLRMDYIKLLREINQQAIPDAECRMIIDQLGTDISRCLKTVAAFDRLDLFDFSSMAFCRVLDVLVVTQDQPKWNELICWMNDAPDQIRAKKLRDLDYRWRPKQVPLAELAKMRENEPYHPRGMKFLNFAKDHLPADPDLLLMTFEYALKQGHVEAALNFGRKILANDPTLDSVREYVFELERSPNTVSLPSKIWWQNQRHASRH